MTEIEQALRKEKRELNRQIEIQAATIEDQAKRLAEALVSINNTKEQEKSRIYSIVRRIFGQIEHLIMDDSIGKEISQLDSRIKKYEIALKRLKNLNNGHDLASYSYRCIEAAAIAEEALRNEL